MSPSHSHSVWSVILAGGDGERTRPFIQQWLGRSQPKQYCIFVGNRSMLQHTLDRADRVGLPHHKVTVIAEHHRDYAHEIFEENRQGHLMIQPKNCGTAAGIFLPLTYVWVQDPNATVVIYPSDHFVFPEDRFAETVRRTTHTIDVLQDRILLLGGAPDSPGIRLWLDQRRYGLRKTRPFLRSTRSVIFGKTQSTRSLTCDVPWRTVEIPWSWWRKSTRCGR